MPTFEDWVEFVFNREIPTDEKSYWDVTMRSPADEQIYARCGDEECWMWVDGQPARSIGWATQLFRDASVLEQYSREQVGRGLWSLLGGSDISIADTLYFKGYKSDRVAPVDLATRCACISEMRTFFAQYVPGHCEPKVDKPSESEPDAVVYMWWDLLVGYRDWNKAVPEGDRVRLADTTIETLAAILELPTPICGWSAIHGLGHMHAAFTVTEAAADQRLAHRVEAIIDSYLHRTPNPPEKLAEYARKARASNGRFQ